MERIDSVKTIGALVALRAADHQIDALVDAYLVGRDPEQFCSKRSELAQEFLNAAPFSELSYRIWRRIAGEGDDEAEAQVAFTGSSMQFLPTVEFSFSH
ncbi:MAG: hypothetical protein WBF24_00295 [Xanthobacteraceae bacterium]